MRQRIFRDFNYIEVASLILMLVVLLAIALVIVLWAI